MQKDERRRHVRTGRRLEVAVAHEGVRLRGVLVDPNPTGALIETEQAFPRGLGLRLYACSPSWPSATIELIARVVWREGKTARLRWVQAVCHHGVLPLVRFLASHIAISLGPGSIETQPASGGRIARYLFPTQPSAGVVVGPVAAAQKREGPAKRVTREVRVTWASVDMRLHSGRARRRAGRLLSVRTGGPLPLVGAVVYIGLPTAHGRQTLVGRVIEVRSSDREACFEVALT